MYDIPPSINMSKCLHCYAMFNKLHGWHFRIITPPSTVFSVWLGLDTKMNIWLGLGRDHV